jgi:xanthine dehydrogenase YagS FAD-binding subunit
MPFEFTSPSTIEEALELHSDGARWFAGGTDIIPEFKAGLAAPTRLVNLKRLPELRGIRFAEDGLHLGALATLTDIAENPRVRSEYAALAQACELAASPQIRNAGTIGGNLCQDSRCPYYRGEFHCYLKGGEICYMHQGENRSAAVVGYHDCVHVHPSDPANALVAFDAEILARGHAGDRIIRAEHFFHAPQGHARRMHVLEQGEFIREILVPRPSPSARSVYLKAMDRATWTFALASAAVRLDLDGAQVREARVVIGGVAPLPWREVRVEALLRGARLDEELAAKAAAEALREAEPLAHNAYKVRLARALVKRALVQLRQVDT